MALDHGHGYKAMELARKLRSDDGEIIAVHVLEALPGYVSNYLSPDNNGNIQQSVKDNMAERIGEAKDAEIVVLIGHAGRSITDYAEKIGADCIVVGSHRPDLKDFFLGSTAARIVRHAPCSVHVLR